MARDCSALLKVGVQSLSRGELIGREGRKESAKQVHAIRVAHEQNHAIIGCNI